MEGGGCILKNRNHIITVRMIAHISAFREAVLGEKILKFLILKLLEMN